MYATTTVTDDLGDLQSSIRGALAALAEQKPALGPELTVLFEQLTEVRNGRLSLGSSLVDLLTFLTQLDEGKAAESEEFRNALAHAHDRVRETTVALLNAAFTA